MTLDLRQLHLEMGKIVYGPVVSRRFGLSLGVNVLPVNKKTCSLDCAYCQLGKTDNPTSDSPYLPTYPNCHEIVTAVEAKLKTEKTRIDVITFSGNGEPTLHPELGRTVTTIQKTLDEQGLGIPINIFTNSTQLGIPTVRNALQHFDQVIAKLDTADQDCFVALNRPIQAIQVSDIVKSLKQLQREIGSKLILQTMLVGSRTNKAAVNYEEKKLVKLAEAIYDIAPSKVQIYTLDRKPAESYLSRVSRANLENAASIIANKLGRDRVQIY